ncbi:MAG: hypothetical protein O3A00_14320 [Planctomycetota bacterium]|nr:hypothetical protein [Planctomycetota bacterium]
MVVQKNNFQRGVGLFLLLTVFASGCGSSDDGPVRFDVSGEVTFAGKPVPSGTIMFVPDNAAGNSGPGGMAVIKDGRYETNGKGVVGGAYIVKIEGYDGVPVRESGEELADGKPMFEPRELKESFPKEKSTKDFKLEKTPAKKSTRKSPGKSIAKTAPISAP